MPTLMLVSALMLGLLCAVPSHALQAQVQTRQGVPTLLVDGRPVPPMMLQYMAGGDATPLTCKLTPQWQQFSYTFRAPADDDNVGGPLAQHHAGGRLVRR